MTRSALFALAVPALLLLALPACGGDDDDSAPLPEPVPEFVEATLRITDAETNALVEGVDVTFEDQAEISDLDGRARVTVPSQATFEIELGADGYPTHTVAGLAGITNFQLGALLVSRATHEALLTALGLTVDAGRGTLIVGLDTIAFQAAQDAIVTISSASDPPFIFVNDAPQPGNELIFGAEDVVVFPNVEPGSVTVDITPPTGDSCLNFPALDSTDNLVEFDVAADEVTVVVFICQ